jgi:hypothetical protein
VGEFFANGEIGPVCVAGRGLGAGKPTSIHAFTTVAATICDFGAESVGGDTGGTGDAHETEDAAWG